MVANNPHMSWKRLAPILLAAAVTLTVSAAANFENRGQTPFFETATCTLLKNGVCPRFSMRAL
jgi:hypothetical protein